MPSLTTLARRHAATATLRAETATTALAAAQTEEADAKAAARTAQAAAYLAGSPARIARLRALAARGSEHGPAEDIDRDIRRALPGLVSYTAAIPDRYRWNGDRIRAKPAQSAPGPLAADALALIDRLAGEATP
jgi:hypothetical protein